MVSDARAAQIINVTMVSILACLALLLAIWEAVAQFPYVHAIYVRLSGEEQRHLFAFINSLWLLVVFAALAGSWRRRRHGA